MFPKQPRDNSLPHSSYLERDVERHPSGAVREVLRGLGGLLCRHRARLRHRVLRLLEVVCERLQAENHARFQVSLDNSSFLYSFVHHIM